MRSCFATCLSSAVGKRGAARRSCKAREGEPGRPPIDPQLLVALWLYATIRGVGSARALAGLCGREIGFQRLCSGVGVNYHTLACGAPHQRRHEGNAFTTQHVRPSPTTRSILALRPVPNCLTCLTTSQDDVSL